MGTARQAPVGGSRRAYLVGAGALVVAVALAVLLSGVGGPGLVLPSAAVLLALIALLYKRARQAAPSASQTHKSLLRRFAGGSRITDRRTALRLIGMSALFAGPLQAVPRVLERALGQEASNVVAQEDQPFFFRVRQWTMIIDLRFCDGCQSVGTPPRCTTSCVEGHLAPAPMQWIEVFEEELPGEGTRFLPTPCQHCQNPPCVNVCPVAATFSTPEGLVLIDQDRCIGCRICMAACPYDRRFFNWGDPPIPPEALTADYDLEVQTPAVKGTVMKCDFCPDMVRAGTLPYCVQACPNQAIYYGDLEEDVASNGVSVVAVSKFVAENDAFVLKEELGTKPRVFYIPGHGEAVGRLTTDEGLLPVHWPWTRPVEGSDQWSR